MTLKVDSSIQQATLQQAAAGRSTAKASPKQAKFIVETIQKPMPRNVDPIRFEWSAAKRNAPFRPWSFGTLLTTARTDYPGTVNAPTEQVLNARLSDFTLAGKFKDSWNYAGYAVEEWRAFEKMVNLVVRFRRVQHRSTLLHEVSGLLRLLRLSYGFLEDEDLESVNGM